MNVEKTIPADELRAQVEAYRTAKENCYDRYAQVLERILKTACNVNLPEAIVQTRSKSVDSFAEKCVRKYGKYKDGILSMTDLCGARVIVQTMDQVDAVRAFIKNNFVIVEEDIKGSDYADTTFSYRDTHYIIRLRADRCTALGISAEEWIVMEGRPAEVQVRTLMQHAWADTLHDRMYKTKLKHPRELRRVAGLLAALMEDGDRSFNSLATEIDGMLANYNAYASREQVEREVQIQELVIANIEEAKRPRLALQVARLQCAQGRYADAAHTLMTYQVAAGPLRPEILTELGFALCKGHRERPAGPDYQTGLAFLENAVTLLKAPDPSVPINARKHNSILARALACRAWALEAVRGRASEARACYQQALQLEPENPYYLSDVLGHEINWGGGRLDIVGAMRASLLVALATCREHMKNDTEMPYACFAAGRLHLLLNEANEALGSYARGIAHILSCRACCPPDVFDTEEEWIYLVLHSNKPSGGFDWVLRLIALARRVMTKDYLRETAESTLTAPVLMVAGGAATLGTDGKNNLVPLLARVFAGLQGTVVSGGTDCGVPGCVGEAAAALGNTRAFKLIGFRPETLPDDAPLDDRYDQTFIAGKNVFTEEQVLRCWEVLMDAGIAPEEIILIGYSGGPIAAFEYRLAVALGASVGLVENSGGTAAALLSDEMWAAMPNLLSLPHDPDTLRAFAHPTKVLPQLTAEVIEGMAQAFHANYVANSPGKLPENMRPWAKLNDTYKTANFHQACYSVEILEACGFVVQPATHPECPVIFTGFTDAEIERMAEMEHGRWNVERLQNGWRHGDRNDEKKRHNCLVPWTDDEALTEEIKGYDRKAVEKFPEIIAQAGLEVRRGKA